MTPFRGSDPERTLLQVGRSLSELRLGGSVLVEADGEALEVRAVEGSSNRRLPPARGGWELVLSAERARALGLDVGGRGAVRARLPRRAKLDRFLALADPLARTAATDDLSLSAATSVERAALALVKFARRLPAALVTRSAVRRRGLARVTPEEVAAFPRLVGRSLRIVSEAHVPLVHAKEARVVLFRPAGGDVEHMAVIVGRPDPEQAVLCRLHSECFTGDVIGSLRCDCGEQLRGALRRMDAEGSGVLLYLAQEGRNIGLANKLRAYQLQDAGLDTVEANLHLGFEADERQWHGAARMLELLGFEKVRLLTNNPEKVEQMRDHGIDVVERVAHAFAANDHNREYLRTKALKSGHSLLEVLGLNGSGAVQRAG